MRRFNSGPPRKRSRAVRAATGLGTLVRALLRAGRYGPGAVGAAALTYGCWSWWHPAGFMILGVLALILQWEVNNR